MSVYTRGGAAGASGGGAQPQPPQPLDEDTLAGLSWRRILNPEAHLPVTLNPFLPVTLNVCLPIAPSASRAPSRPFWGPRGQKGPKEPQGASPRWGPRDPKP